MDTRGKVALGVLALVAVALGFTLAWAFTKRAEDFSNLDEGEVEHVGS